MKRRFLGIPCSSTLLLSVLAPICATQEPPVWRSESALHVPFTIENPRVHGVFYVGSASGPDAGKLQWFQQGPLGDDEAGFTGERSIPIDLPGSLTPADQDRRFLITGYDSVDSQGRLLYVELDPSGSTSVSLLNTVDLGSGVDPVALHWGETVERIFIIDRRSRVVWSAPWSGGQPIPTDFSIILNSAVAPFLDGHDRWGFTENEAHKVLVTGPLKGEYHILSENSGAWSVSTYPYDPGLPLSRVEVRNPEAVNALWPLEVRGPAGTVEVWDGYSDSIILTATIPADAWTQIEGVAEMVPGHFHRVVHGASDAPLLPLARYGEPGPSNGISVREGFVAWDKHFVGSTEFGAASTIALTDPTISPYTIDVYLWIAAGIPGDPPPVVTVDSTTVLVASDTLGPWQFVLKNEDPIARIGAPYPIPDDPALQGVRVYFQFASTAPRAGTSVSDVFAVDLLGPNDLAMLRDGGRLTPPVAPRGERKRAIREWFGTGLAPVETAVYRELVRRIARRR